MEEIYSERTGKYYRPSQCVRLVNMKQWAFYAKKGITTYDFYPTTDVKTGEDIMAFIVNKQESYEAYQEWLARRDKIKKEYDL